MKRIVLSALIGLSLLGHPAAQESIALTAPVVTQATTTVLRPARVNFNLLLGRVEVTMMRWNGIAFINTDQRLDVVYDATTTPTGLSLIIALNKANFSTANNSLERRIMAQLIASGYLAGTVSGTPQ